MTVTLLVTRAQWGAAPPTAELPLQPMRASRVYVHHTAGPSVGPVGQVRAAQRHAMSTHTTTGGVEAAHHDIDYSFLFDLSGVAYEGRGWGTIPAATRGLNSGSYAMCAIGNFDTSDRPSDTLLAAMASVIVDGIEAGWLATDVEILGHRDVLQTACPGRFLYTKLPTLRATVQTILAAHLAPPTTPEEIPVPSNIPINLTAFVYGDSKYANRWLVFGGSPLHIGPALSALLRQQGVTEVLEAGHSQTLRSLLTLSGLKESDLVPA